MRKVHEYEIRPGQRNVCQLPCDGIIVGIEIRNNLPHLVMVGDPGNGKETREFMAIGRNQGVPDGGIKGTCNISGKFYVVVEID